METQNFIPEKEMIDMIPVGSTVDAFGMPIDLAKKYDEEGYPIPDTEKPEKKDVPTVH